MKEFSTRALTIKKTNPFSLIAVPTWFLAALESKFYVHVNQSLLSVCYKYLTQLNKCFNVKGNPRAYSMANSGGICPATSDQNKLVYIIEKLLATKDQQNSVNPIM